MQCLELLGCWAVLALLEQLGCVAAELGCCGCRSFFNSLIPLRRRWHTVGVELGTVLLRAVMLL